MMRIATLAIILFIAAGLLVFMRIDGFEAVTGSGSCKPFNIDDYVRKDSIPCYGCSLK